MVGNLPFTFFVGVDVRVTGLDLVTGGPPIRIIVVRKKRNRSIVVTITSE